MSHTFDNAARLEARRREREEHIARMEDMARPQLENLQSLSTLSPQQAIMQLPDLGRRQSSRHLLDFDSQHLLSMEEIHDNARQKSSRLLSNDEDSRLEDEQDDYPTNEEILSPEDARMYAGLLLDKSAMPKQSTVRNSTRTFMNLTTTIRNMNGPNENPFASSLDLISSMEADEIPSKRTGMSGRRVVCIIGTLLIALLVAIIVALKSSGSLEPAPSSPQAPGPPPQDPPTPRMKAVVSYLTKNGVSDPTALNKVGTPQQKAADWIANTDSLLDADEEEYRFVQRYIMAVFYYSLGGPEWKNQADFLGMKDECSWSYESPTDSGGEVYTLGITCNAYSRVEALLLPSNNLTGSLPSELSLLTSLDLLDLRHNQISGSIPDVYQSLKSLEGFELQYNVLTGTLPSFFGEMTDLRVLTLSNNGLEGSLPSSMSNLKHLTTLALDDNRFTGDMASAVNGMVNLKYLYVDNNLLDSIIDDSFMVQNTQLEEVDMSGNRFTTNRFPAHLFLMMHLRVIDLHENDLGGRLPNDIPRQLSLEILDLSSNRLSGTIPSSIQQLSFLTHLDISSNQFTGLIPYAFSSMRNLSYLSLSNNPLDEDPFPECVAFLTNLKELSMAKTGRMGTLPEWLGDLSNLVLLDLGENELTGTIPDSIWDLAALKYLLLQRNHLEGSVSKGLLRSESLDVFAVDKNDLMDDWTRVCSQVSVGFLSADCGGKFQEVFCRCCTVCCQDKDPECNDDLKYSKLNARWEGGFTRTAYDFGPNQIYGDAATNAPVDAQKHDEVYGGDNEDEGTSAPVKDEENYASESGGGNRDFL